ncbi:hypothetical protein BDW42DRAFT_180829 [Aspergillus taichungensis]|uniref:Uncharacterized protein n=1 Tax=Aspergillus taichungensis TaxID=482145 RepID=A0A2J5HET1_9EURO|nr:hypothetical protein BDW42DRAFT_180829 [Aspergillus taichungensis]
MFILHLHLPLFFSSFPSQLLFSLPFFSFFSFFPSVSLLSLSRHHGPCGTSRSRGVSLTSSLYLHLSVYIFISSDSFLSSCLSSALFSSLVAHHLFIYSFIPFPPLSPLLSTLPVDSIPFQSLFACFCLAQPHYP